MDQLKEIAGCGFFRSRFYRSHGLGELAEEVPLALG
ncbi:hypothetical protein ACVIWU_005841 [Bradyrhizobium sp. USDA 4509]|nr:hypothetical protein [Bradyrhizobium elkanii]